MIVYKFGGASVASSAGVERVFEIVKDCDRRLVVVVSAMGKTTNKLEIILDNIIQQNTTEAFRLFEEIKIYHTQIIEELGLSVDFIEHIFNTMHDYIQFNKFNDKSYEFRYDSFVSFGEMLSSTILAAYFTSKNYVNKLLDMRDIVVTDSTFREAKVDFNKTSARLNRAISLGFKTYIAQGFIGGNDDGEATTLGREGSDYSAAIVANVLVCSSVTIWKDVDGVYNADPKEFKNTVLMPQLPYSFAVELAYSGAQIIHSKTIKPLENKDIPLYVKPFKPSESEGTVINNVATRITTPIFIKKKNQCLISISPKNFAFALEERMEDILNKFNQFRHKINIIQTSAISISISTTNSRNFEALIEELQNNYIVKFNEGLEILTIKNYTPELLQEAVSESKIYIEQRTRSTVRLLIKAHNE